MGCCCDHDDEEEESHLTIPLSSSDFPSGESAVISPMNSNFSALNCRDTLRLIFEKLSITDLARSSCVCRAWNAVASGDEMVVGAFKAPWKLKEVVGRPTSRSFWRDNGIGKFAISHRISRGDSVASLAVKYSVQRVVLVDIVCEVMINGALVKSTNGGNEAEDEVLDGMVVTDPGHGSFIT
ncbi:hypothetical protein SLEP1_g10848 [Rubroshorea leprosula]|uniref:F-box domain-containing protein n=1 Tax=Rubroshorea leprosula TaxID=152421 RepID=A0AAV5IDW3_9ROSI|nr:hypothetical protein SLEP1_g10848 [Rubroshorea leprosula]